MNLKSYLCERIENNLFNRDFIVDNMPMNIEESTKKECERRNL